MIQQDLYYWPRSFKINEILPPMDPDDQWKVLRLMRQDVADGLDAFRRLIGKPLYINNWEMGTRDRSILGLTKYSHSGFRSRACNIGSKESLHRYLLAFDIKCPTMSVGDMFSKFMYHWNLPEWKDLKVFTEVEDISLTPTWIHLGAANRININKPVIIKP